MFMTRLLFCLFAEDTSIFEQGLFTRTALSVSQDDGSDFAEALSKIFKSLAVAPDKRDALPDSRATLPLRQRRTLSAGRANPDVLSSSTAAFPRMRRAEVVFDQPRHLRVDGFKLSLTRPCARDLGMHYTSVPNIMKALQPLFLLSLEEDFDQARDSEAKLMRLLKRIYSIRVFDSACGSGNFLIIAYRELRKLESRVFMRLADLGKSAIPMTGVHLSQFYGIELADFAAETAKLSLWIAEYQMNELFKEQFGTASPALPLRDSGNIVHGNALHHDWLDVCPQPGSAEIYVVGNPPYLGRARQTAEQKEDLARRL
ncbi:DNA methyltransferase [Cupriavidus basilensis]